ncbi:MAG TPA: hypothetical protein VF215_17180, partial [Thermoanaerobaculia bacterium]
MLNLTAGPWRLAGVDDPVSFDLDADGEAERIGWTAADSGLAFLSIDLNANGAIDDGAELFGIGTLIPGGVRASNGFEALRQYDTNGDRVLDAADAHWSSLLLWTDRNHDGKSSIGELLAIRDSE